MADHMDVPPLEDMSDVLQKILSRRDTAANGSSSIMPGRASSDSARSDGCAVDGRISSLVS